MEHLIKKLIVDGLAGYSYRNLPGFLFAFLVCACLAYILGRVYIRYGNSVANRKVFARNFVVLALTTMFIISVVKSSLALSLGLVGALSIVRFRTAIKEPEELSYLFLTIAIGLGCGAGLTILTIIAFGGFITVIWFKNKKQKAVENQSLYLTISSTEGPLPSLKEVVSTMDRSLTGAKLKRWDVTQNALEASFVVGVSDYTQLEVLQAELQAAYTNLNVSFLDTSRDF